MAIRCSMTFLSAESVSRTAVCVFMVCRAVDLSCTANMPSIKNEIIGTILHMISSLSPRLPHRPVQPHAREEAHTSLYCVLSHCMHLEAIPPHVRYMENISHEFIEKFEISMVKRTI